MVRFTCNCLNIILNVNQNESRLVKGRQILGINEQNGESLPLVSVDDFFATEVSDIKLSFAGIETQQKLLVKERNVGDYRVTRCISCDIDTHALHKVKGLERVLANQHLQSGDQIIEDLKTSRNYSPAFKIILPCDSNLDLFGKGSSQSISMFQKSMSQATSIVNEIVKKFIVHEEEDKNERIRIYAEKQQQLFSDLEKRVDADRDNFLRVLCIKEEQAVRDSLTDAMRDTTFKVGSFGSEPEDVTSELPKFINKKHSKRKQFADNDDQIDSPIGIHMNSAPSRVLAGRYHSHSKPVSSGKVKSPARTTRTVPTSINRRRTKSETDDTMFDLDGFHDNKNCEPFFESDEDSSGDSNSLEGSGGYFIPSRGGSAHDRVYATSVPVTVPIMDREPKQLSDEHDETPPSPERMAESIKALARSIHDSTSMFGELPRASYTQTHRP